MNMPAAPKQAPFNDVGKGCDPEATVVSLRESEARFRALTELSSDRYWEQDENLRFVYLSEGFFRKSGVRPEKD